MAVAQKETGVTQTAGLRLHASHLPIGPPMLDFLLFFEPNGRRGLHAGPAAVPGSRAEAAAPLRPLEIEAEPSECGHSNQPLVDDFLAGD